MKQGVATAANRQAAIRHFGQPLQQAAIPTLAKSAEAFVHGEAPCKERTFAPQGGAADDERRLEPAFDRSRSSEAKRRGAEWKAGA